MARHFKHNWTKQFRDYLRKRNLSDDETTLHFLVVTQAVLVLDNKIASAKGNKKHKYRQDQETIFNKAVKRFFSEESEDLLSLSNQKLFESLSETSRSDSKSVTDEQLGHLKKARQDSSVWAEGLEPTFLAFLKQTSPSAIACLLSIL